MASGFVLTPGATSVRTWVTKSPVSKPLAQRWETGRRWS